MKNLVYMVILCLLGTGTAMGQNNRWFHARARVINLEPVIKPDYATVPKAHCRQAVLTIASSMTQDIRRQEHKLERQLACEARTRTSHRVVGYWVTYDYNGHEGRKYMSDKPGSWISVTVSLEPLQASQLR
jgi:hypothetical protein